MRYRTRRHWPALLGTLVGALLLVAGWRASETTVGVAAAAVAVAAGLGGEVLLEHRAGIVRERRLVSIAADLRSATAELARLATTDPLTGTLNRRAFFEALGTEFRRARRYGRNLSVVMVDVDNFKAVNDCGGHLFGDDVLRTTARLIVDNTRESDLVARYGGEEFVVMLPETDEAGAEAVAEKLLRAVEALSYRAGDFPPPDAPAWRLTASAGVACGPVEVGQDETELVRRADQALYAAKAAGKNRVHRWTPDGSRAVAPGGA